jgi:hypothetical protein
MARWCIAWSLSLAACSPAAPFHLTETAEVARRGQVVITGAAGGGVAGGPDVKGATGFGGIGTRVRVGVGQQQEVGVEGTAIGGDTKSAVWGAKASYKGAPAPWFAVVGGFGYTHYLGSAVGPDLALVFSQPVVPGRLVGVYGGVRGSVMVPTYRDIYRDGGITETLLVPVGLWLAPAQQVRLYLEAGFIASYAQAHTMLDSLQPVVRSQYYGGYGTLGVAFLWPAR